MMCLVVHMKYTRIRSSHYGTKDEDGSLVYVLASL